MSFLALATLLTATTTENAIITQVEALDQWRAQLGFLPAISKEKRQGKAAGQHVQYVLTATSPQALDDLAKTHTVERISPYNAIINNPSDFDHADERILSIEADDTGAFAQVEPEAELTRVNKAAPQPDTDGTKGFSPFDPLRIHQWGLDQIKVDDATPRGSSKHKIAILDSGIFDQHPDLAGRVTKKYYTANNKVEEIDPSNNQCRKGHGTLVAGFTSATAFNGIGGRGIAPDAQLIDINTVSSVDCKKGPTLGATLTSIQLAIDLEVDVIVMSYGFRWGYCTLALQQAIDRARAAGITVVAAAGNQHGFPLTHQPEAPASCDGVISVGATMRGGQVSDFSTRNNWVDVTAPGGKIDYGSSFGPYSSYVLTTNWDKAPDFPKTEYVGVAGTSFSTAQVAGLALLIKQARPTASPDEVESIIEHTATRAQDTYSSAQGWGEINVERAVAMAKDVKPVPTPAFNLPYPVRAHSLRKLSPKPQTITRIGGAKDPIAMAVQISQHTFINQGESVDTQRRGQAQWGVLARADVHADALAGASLTLGASPLLYTTNTLDTRTAAEFTRTLKPGSTIYLLGGPEALPKPIEASIKELGFNPVRLGGETRIETSIEISKEVRKRVKEVTGKSEVSASLLTADNAWPDSIGAGYLGAMAGLPVLLNPKNELLAKVKDVVQHNEIIYLVGGVDRISEHVQWTLSSSRNAGYVARLAGPDRAHTMVKTAAQMERLRTYPIRGIDLVNFDHEHAWTTALAAAVPSAAFAHIPAAVSEQKVDPDVLNYIKATSVPINAFGSAQLISDTVTNAAENAVSSHIEHN